MSEKKLFNIYHGYDVDGGFGDAIWREDVIGTVWATEEEIEEFVAKWDKQVVYDRPYMDLTCHNIRASEVDLVDIHSFIPYEEDIDPFGLSISNDRYIVEL